MKILVTGATGFVGAACADALERAGHHVVCGARRPVVPSSPGQNWIVHGDLASRVDWRHHLAGCGGVLHCAGLASISRGITARELDAINVAATEQLAAAALEAGVQRFVFMSSAFAAAAEPGNGYALSKRAAEQKLIEIAGGGRMACIILRPPMVYGARNAGNFARLVRMVRSGYPLPFGCATAPKSLVAIDNLASAVVRIFDAEAAASNTYFVADREQTSTSALVGSIARATGVPTRLVPVPVTAMRALGAVTGKSREIRSLFDAAVVDTSGIREALDWTPPLAQDDAIRQAVIGIAKSDC